MKQFCTLAAALAFVMSSCSSNDSISTATPPDGVIGFSTQETLQADNFYVFAARHTANYAGEAPSYIEDKMIEHSTTATDMPEDWDYDPYAYWPKNTDKVSFFAYAPHAVANGKITLSSNDEMTLSYTTPAKYNDQVDLMAAQALNQTQNSDKGIVHLEFKHLLAKVGFSILPKVNITELKAITINNIVVTYGSGLIKKGVYSYKNQSWTLGQGASAQFEFEEITQLVTEDTPVTSVGAVIHPEGVDNYLKFLPQEYGADALAVTVAYTVTNRESDGKGGYTVKNTFGFNQSAKLPVVSGGWKSGKQYIYSIGVGGNTLEIAAPEVTGL